MNFRLVSTVYTHAVDTVRGFSLRDYFENWPFSGGGGGEKKKKFLTTGGVWWGFRVYV